MVTVAGLQIAASKTRANHFPNAYHERADTDGHWGVQYSEQRAVLPFRIAACGGHTWITPQAAPLYPRDVPSK
jgi:hypothetical protein